MKKEIVKRYEEDMKREIDERVKKAHDIEQLREVLDEYLIRLIREGDQR
jgi:hypothetical protein